MQRLQHGTSADGVSKPPWQQVALALDCGLSKHEPSPFYAECSLEDLLEVLPIAASQKLSNVLDQCITILKCSLTPENCLAVLAIADHYHACCSELFDTALRFIEASPIFEYEFCAYWSMVVLFLLYNVFAGQFSVRRRHRRLLLPDAEAPSDDITTR